MGVVAEFLQLRLDPLQALQTWAGVPAEEISTESEFSSIESERCHTRSNAALMDSMTVFDVAIRGKPEFPAHEDMDIVVIVEHHEHPGCL